MSVVGVVDGQTTSGLSGPAEKKSKKSEVKKSSSSKPAKPEKSVKPSSSRPPAASPSQGKSTTSTTDSKISELDKKLADRFNRLKALLLAKTVDLPQDPTLAMVNVAPTHTPPANIFRSDPFLKRQSSLVTDRPAADPPTTDPSQHTSTKVPSSSQPEPATAHMSQRHLSSAFDTSRKETSSP